MKTYSVNLWGSHPDAGNDDCWTGADFETLAEAEALADALLAGRPLPPLDFDPRHLLDTYAGSTTHVEVARLDRGSVPTTSETLRVTRTPHAGKVERRAARQAAQDDADWSRERVMQAGMAFGCDGRNDAMGY